MKADSIIFDLDGTLWDSAKPVAESWNVIFKKYNLDKVLTSQDIMGVMGLVMEDIIKKLLPEVEEKFSLEVLKTCCIYENEYVSMTGGILFPNLEETLHKLHKTYKLAIVSNCQEGYIEAFYKAHKLEKYFMDYENPGRTGLDKAGNISLVVKRNGFANPVYVGDTLGDRLSAKKAGVPFIYASYGFGQVKDYDAILESIDQLPELLQP